MTSELTQTFHSQLPWGSVNERKKAEQESVLERFPDWRLPEVLYNDVLDVSTIVLSGLSDRERQIVAYDAVELVKRIKNREYTAVEVLTAFCKVATAAQETTNCLTEIFFEDGLKRAEELDRHLKATGEVVGPLHGLPISLKDQISVKGHFATAGYTKWVSDGPAEQDAPIITQLRKAGGVFYVKTNIPQTLMVCLLTIHPIKTCLSIS
jgi:amidase